VFLLALDTSTLHAALALSRADGPPLVAPPDPATRHGRGLVPAIRDLLRQAGVALADLDGLAVGLGPGSYTGLRVGLMAAKALAYAARKPLVGLDSLEVVARNAPADAPRVAVVADAQRGDLAVAEFARPGPDAPLVRLGPTRIEPAALVPDRLPPSTLVLGPGLDRLKAPWPDALLRGDPSWDRPDGARLAALALDVWATGRRDDPWSLEPVYLRRSAAEDKWDPR
jgi:tRNA threonylcarbamoyladenosine biosynthesis protein TsaB